MNHNEIRRYLSVIKRAVSLIEGMLEDDGGLLEQMVEPTQSVVQQMVQPAMPIQQPVEPVKPATPALSEEELKAFQIERKRHIDDLMAIDCWPEAVPAFLLTKDVSAQDQSNRADAVLDMMVDRRIEGLNFLDFGCGEGWIAKRAKARGVKTSVGYDVQLNQNWAKLAGDGVTYTHIYNELLRSHYDVIFLYDVLDHCESPVEVMKQVRNCLAKDGTVYVRCHPWTSKHATHVYKNGLNKGYIHLFLTWAEIAELTGQHSMFTRMEKNALEAYHWWFDEFEIKKEKFVKEPVAEFFHVPSFKELLANEQSLSTQEVDALLDKMQIQFVDYCLTPKKK